MRFGNKTSSTGALEFINPFFSLEVEAGTSIGPVGAVAPPPSRIGLPHVFPRFSFANLYFVYYII